MDTREDVDTVPHLVRRAARVHAGRPYVVTSDQRLTFDDAEARSRLWAQRLIGAGIGKGSRVGLLFPQGADFVVAFLAIARVGAIAVPMSTFARAPELRRALAHTDVGLLLAPRTLGGRGTEDLFEEIWPSLTGATKPQLAIEDAPYLRGIWICGGDEANLKSWAVGAPSVAGITGAQEISDALLARVEAEVAPADPAVIVSTSGATAEPKAVVHTQGALARQARAMAELYELSADDGTFTNMPFFWVGGLTVVVLSHLHVGATVVTVERMDTGEMLDVIERARPTRLLGWTLYERLTADPTFASRDLSSIVEMRPPELATSGLRHSSLGMTETGGPHTAASRTSNARDLPEHLRGSFGPPVPGMEHKIVESDTGEEVAAGVEGEICVRGDGLMVGLYKKERRETFDADGWYHTGDKGYLRDGYLFFTGRLTEMIKTGGANVAPREVELVLESHPGVQAAFVVGLPDAERGELVGCVVCPEPGYDLDAGALTEMLRNELASYKVPRTLKLVPYDDMPWLPTGKMSKPRIIELLCDGHA